MGRPYPRLGFKNGFARKIARFPSIPRDRGLAVDGVDNPSPEANRWYGFAESGIISGPRGGSEIEGELGNT